jgi:2-polyprenyl-3-methyl-5-hydroxy-6-metoxy-1,4-benzoquinol methylase
MNSQAPNRKSDTPQALSAATLSRAARQLWTDGPAVPRLMQHFRPYICPFDKLLVQVHPDSRVLDIGCGRGLFLGLLHHVGRLSASSDLPSVGFDCNRMAIDDARSMSRRANAGRTIRFEHRNATDTWPEGEFDVVSIIDVMHHLPTAMRRTILQHAAAKVRPGGILLYKDMTSRSWRSIANSMHDLAVAREWISYTPVATIETWASDAGLHLRHAETFKRFWYGHELRVFARPGAIAAHA